MSKTAIRCAIAAATLIVWSASQPGWAQSYGNGRDITLDHFNSQITPPRDPNLGKWSGVPPQSDLATAIAKKDYPFLLKYYQSHCKAEDIPLTTAVESFAKNGTGVANCYYLGELYRNGQGVPADLKTALPFYQMAAEGGYWPAVQVLAGLYLEGKDVPPDAAKAIGYLTRFTTRAGVAPDLACQGAVELGAIYDTGKYGPANGPEAVKWYSDCVSRTAKDGKTFPEQIRAMTLLANLYADGKVVKPDAAKAAAIYQQVSYEIGAPPADRANAQYHLGQFYLTGQGVAKDTARGITLLKAAAEVKHRGAAFALYKVYAADPGGDPAQASLYLAQAADLDVVEAQYLMGEKALQANPPNLNEARSWLQSAALQGDVEAQFAMGAFDQKYASDTADGLAQAYMWFDLAAQNKDSRAEKARADLAAKLPADTVTRAKATEAQLKAKFPEVLAG